MDPYTLAALSTAKAGFEFGTKLLEFWITPQGQLAYAKMLNDQAQMEAFWKGVGDNAIKLFTGELFKPKP